MYESSGDSFSIDISSLLCSRCSSHSCSVHSVLRLSSVYSLVVFVLHSCDCLINLHSCDCLIMSHSCNCLIMSHSCNCHILYICAFFGVVIIVMFLFRFLFCHFCNFYVFMLWVNVVISYIAILVYKYYPFVFFTCTGQLMYGCHVCGHWQYGPVVLHYQISGV